MPSYFNYIENIDKYDEFVKVGQNETQFQQDGIYLNLQGTILLARCNFLKQKMPIINQQSNNGYRSQKSTNRYPTYGDSVKQCRPTRLESVHPSKTKESTNACREAGGLQQDTPT